MNQIFRDEARQDQFERQGFTIARLLSATQCADLLRRVEEICKGPQGSPEGMIDQSFCTPDAEYRQRADVIISDAIRESLEALIADYRLMGCGMMIKNPRTGAMPIH